ncbi:MAG: VOC family protein [Steroidobacteraceae bacterium]
MLMGRFLEVGIATRNIAASVSFYERLGLWQLTAGDTWSHPYGVLTDGRLVIGLHQRSQPELSISFVRPGLASHLQELRSRGISPHYTRLGEEDFHELQLHDPTGQSVTLLEARTYSPSDNGGGRSLCGYFSALSLPALDFDTAQAFWDHAGFLPHEPQEAPYPHLLLGGERMNLALHRPRFFDAPLLVFELDDAATQLAQLRDRGFSFSSELPRNLPADSNALLESPDGTYLLLSAAR